MKNIHQLNNVILEKINVIPAKAGIHYRINKAQSTIEFTFAMIAIMFLIYGMVQVFRWAGMDLAQRRFMQDNALMTLSTSDPSSELGNDAADTVMPIAAVYHGNVSNGNVSQ